MFVTLANSFGEIIQPIIDNLPLIITSIVDALVNNLPILIDGLITLTLALVEALPEIMQVFSDATPTVISKIVEALIAAIPQLLAGIGQVIMAVGAQLPTLIGTLAQNIVAPFVGIFSGLWNGIKDIFSPLGETLQSVWDNVVNGVQTAFTAVVDWFKSLGESIKSAWNGIIEWFKSVPDMISSGFSALKDFFINLFTNIGSAITNGFTNAMNFISQLPEKIAYWLGFAIGTVASFVVNFANKAKEAGTNFVNNLISFIQSLPGKIQTWFTNTINKVTTFASNMVNKAKEAGTNFVNNLVNFVQTLPSKIGAFLTNTIARVTTFVSQLIAKGIQAGTNFVNNVVNGVQSLPSKIASFLQNVITKVASFASTFKQKALEAGREFGTNLINALKSIPSKVLSIGKDIVDGIWNGITKSWGNLTSKVGNLANKLVEGFRAGFKINSPSKLMRDKVGMSIGEGIGDGIIRSYSKLKGVVNTFSGNVVNSFKNALGIHSPARVTRDEVGKPLVEGIAVGIKENSGEVSDEFQKMLDDLQLQRDLDLINDKDYYIELEKLRDTYLEKGTKDWWQYTKDIIDYEANLVEEQEKSLEELNSTYEQYVTERKDLTSNFYKQISKNDLYNTINFENGDQTISWTVLNDWEDELESLDTFEDKITSVQNRLKSVFTGDDESLQSILDTIRSDPFGEGAKTLDAMFNASDEQLNKFATGYKQFIEKSKYITNRVYEADLKNFDDNFLQKISEKFVNSSLFEEIKSVGENLTESLMDGISNKGEWLKEQIIKFCNSISQTFNDGFSVSDNLQLSGVNDIDTVRNYQIDYTNQLNNINDTIDKLISLLGEYLPGISQKMDRPIIVDGDSLAVGISKKIDFQLGKMSISKDRGNV